MKTLNEQLSNMRRYTRLFEADSHTMSILMSNADLAAALKKTHLGPDDIDTFDVCTAVATFLHDYNDNTPKVQALRHLLTHGLQFHQRDIVPREQMEYIAQLIYDALVDGEEYKEVPSNLEPMDVDAAIHKATSGHLDKDDTTKLSQQAMAHMNESLMVDPKGNLNADMTGTALQHLRTGALVFVTKDDGRRLLGKIVTHGKARETVEVGEEVVIMRDQLGTEYKKAELTPEQYESLSVMGTHEPTTQLHRKAIAHPTSGQLSEQLDKIKSWIKIL